MSNLECYAVFEGGGVKGSAFAGALAAAENAKINFVGYGGASVGGIIAFLACLGFNAKELEEKIKSLDLSLFLDSEVVNETKLLQQTLDENKKIANEAVVGDLYDKVILNSRIFKNAFRLQVIKAAFKIIFRLKRNLGIHSKKDMINVLIKYAKEKISENNFSYVDGNASITFETFFKLTGKDLRLVATDLNTKRAVKFSHIATPNYCIFKAVAASASFPFFYEPSIEDELYLTDGGVSCNLPSFLFANEGHKRLPIYAFDLITDDKNASRKKKTSNNIFSHTWRLFNALLDASTEIISEEVGCITVPVIIPSEINTLNFNLSIEKVNELYESGKDSAEKFFMSHEMTKLAAKANTPHQVGALLYGIYDELLIDLAYRLSEDENLVKTWLYTCINSSPKEIISFSAGSNGEDPAHYRYKLNTNTTDCVESWLTKEIKFTCDEELQKVRICFPIMKNISYAGETAGEANNTILGVLCISMDCVPSDCNWLKKGGNTCLFDISEDIVILIKAYTKIISMAMLGNQLIFHENKNGIMQGLIN